MQPTAIITVFVEVIVGLIKGITQAVVDGFDTLFIAEGGGITNFAIWMIIGGAIGFVIALQKGLFRKAKV